MGRRRRLPLRRVAHWALVVAVAAVAYLYYRPLTSYLETRSAVRERAAEVRDLRAENARLRERVVQSETLAALSREARRSSLVRPGERLFIVKGIEEWRQARRTMPPDG